MSGAQVLARTSHNHQYLLWHSLEKRTGKFQAPADLRGHWTETHRCIGTGDRSRTARNVPNARRSRNLHQPRHGTPGGACRGAVLSDHSGRFPVPRVHDLLHRSAEPGELHGQSDPK